MKTRILVLGKTGMLGHVVFKYLSEDDSLRVDGTHIAKKRDLFYFDATNGIEKLVLIYKSNGGYDYFINCIGITKDKINEDNTNSVLNAIKINSVFPQELALFSERKGVRTIHISTDGVFSPLQGTCNEKSPADCTDIYGKTKNLGEAKSKNFLTIRCSIIGPSPFKKRGLFEWFRSQPDGGKIYGYKNHIWNGVTTLQFAELCRTIIKKGCFDELIKESYVHHFCPNRAISKYQLLGIFKSALKKNIQVTPINNNTSPIKRILTTKHSGLKDIFGRNKDIRDAVQKLYKYI